MAKAQTVKSILFYYIIDTKLLRTVVARIALMLCPAFAAHWMSLAYLDFGFVPSAIFFRSPAVSSICLNFGLM